MLANLFKRPRVTIIRTPLLALNRLISNNPVNVTTTSETPEAKSTVANNQQQQQQQHNSSNPSIKSSLYFDKSKMDQKAMTDIIMSELSMEQGISYGRSLAVHHGRVGLSYRQLNEMMDENGVRPNLRQRDMRSPRCEEGENVERPMQEDLLKPCIKRSTSCCEWRNGKYTTIFISLSISEWFHEYRSNIFIIVILNRGLWWLMANLICLRVWYQEISFE